MPRICAEERSRKGTMSTAWRRPTRLSRIIGGEKRTWLVVSCWLLAEPACEFNQQLTTNNQQRVSDYATNGTARTDEEYRNCRAYRRRQDDHHRAHLVLHRANPQAG